MKRIMLFCCLMTFANLNKVNASFVPPNSIAHKATWENLKASKFVKFSPKELEAITGKKMSLTERISFSFTKMKMRKSLKKNPDLTVKEYYSSSKKLGTGWIIAISA